MAENLEQKQEMDVVLGTGDPFRVPLAEARDPRLTGKIQDVLAELIARHARNPEQARELLEDATTTIEAYTVTREDEVIEDALTPMSDWQEFVERHLRNAEAVETEIALQRVHRGGQSERRFENPVEYHDAEWTPSDDVREQIESGNALLWTGRALAKWETATRAADHSEILAYGLAGCDRPEVIIDIALPRQQGSAGYVRVDPADATRARREAKRRGLVIKQVVHSHGHGAVFTSSTDRNQMRELSAENCGLQVAVTRRRVAMAPETVQESE